MSDTPIPGPSGPLRGHPIGLAIIVMTGLWEVFALFGMRTVLVFYLVEIGFRPSAAVEIYSFSTAAAFAMALVGAVVADRLLGTERAVVVGALVMAAGHLLLALPQALYPALALVILGNCLFKPSLVSQIGRLYQRDDPRRDRAFVFYKAGCNAGAIFSPIACGLMGQAYGWRAAIAMCGIGMGVSALIFLFGRRLIRVVEQAAEHGPPAPGDAGGSIAGMASLLLVLICGVLFWTAHGQQGGTIALWAEGSVDRQVTLLGHSLLIPAAWLQSVNPIVIVLFTPLLTWLWSRRDRQADRTHEMRKMAIGALLLCGSFAVVAASAAAAGGRLSSIGWLVLALVLLAIGELYFDAIGQALLVRLAPASLTTVFISLWFLAQALGFAFAGWLGRAWEVLPPSAYFLIVAGVAGSAALLAGAMTTRRLVLEAA